MKVLVKEIELDSKPDNLDELDRKIMQLNIEKKFYQKKKILIHQNVLNS